MYNIISFVFTIYIFLSVDIGSHIQRGRAVEPAPKCYLSLD